MLDVLQINRKTYNVKKSEENIMNGMNKYTLKKKVSIPIEYIDPSIDEIKNDNILNISVENNLYSDLEDDHVKDSKIARERKKDFDEISVASAHEIINNKSWIRNKNGIDYFISILTMCYALILISFSLVIELSSTFSESNNSAETFYYAWMYGLGSVFMLYIYLFMLYPKWWNIIVFFLYNRGIIRNINRFTIPEVGHNGEGAGTLYLRLGAVLFGCLSIVLFGLEIFLCARESNCKQRFVAEHCFLIIFVAMQMHFIFCNTKMSITSSRVICKFGFMHLVAVNLWTWVRFVISKQQTKTEKKLKKKLAAAIEQEHGDNEEEDDDSDDDHSIESSEENESTTLGIVNDKIQQILSKLPTGAISNITDNQIILSNASEVIKNTNTSRTLASVDYLGDMASILTTCLVEYALIGAAVMFILWKSIDMVNDQTIERMKRRSKMRIDCTSTSIGIFLGVFVLILSCISMGINSVYNQLHMDSSVRIATSVFYFITYGMCLIGTAIALLRMRRLQYKEPTNEESLDQILMVVGMISEFLYCACEIDLFLTGQGSNGTSYGPMPVFIFIVFIIRLIQVVSQSAFILLSFRLSAINPREQRRMAGRQMVTYLLVANVSLFAFHIYEGIATTIGYDGPDESAYQIIIYAVTPIIAFYRFHSSVCLAEIWKHSYTFKAHGNHSNGTSTMSS